MGKKLVIDRKLRPLRGTSPRRAKRIAPPQRTLFAKGKQRAPIKKRQAFACLFFIGMSGDTELFENPSNIKGLWASEQKIILYIPLF